MNSSFSFADVRSTFRSAVASCLTIGSLVAFSACQSLAPLPVLKYIDGTNERIQAGEEAFVAWEFSNCDSVRIVGLDEVFMPKDTYRFFPRVTKTHDIVAYKDADSSIFTRTVYVEPIVVQSGGEDMTPMEPIVQHSPTMVAPPWNLQYSTQQSEYFIGYDKSQKDASLMQTSLRILRTIPEKGEMHAAVIDEYGNFIPSLDSSQTWNYLTRCGDGTIDTAFAFVEQMQLSQDTAHFAITLCADFAMYMKQYEPELRNSYTTFFEHIPPKEIVSFVPFDHRLRESFQNIEAYNVPKYLPFEQFDNLGGMTALYKAMQYGMNIVNTQNSLQKILVIVSGGAESASLVYTIDDIVQKAQQNNIIVYTIGVGSGADTYPLKYLADATGGVAYLLTGEEIAQTLPSVLEEIANSLKMYYRIVPPESVIRKRQACNDAMYAALQPMPFVLPSRAVALSLPRQVYYPTHQVLATFSSSSNMIEEKFESQIYALATLLIDNPDKKIQLIGHSSTDGSDRTNKAVGMKRAETVKQSLVQLGVPPSQIRIRSAGSRTPIYYFESEEWQATMNRRVELRWLDPALYPFELTAGISYTEEEAIQRANLWAERGYNAEYELINLNGTTAFAIKLWGFRSEAAAQAEKQEIRKRYNVNVSLE
jgi:hypothetical protein